jgi:nitroreductase/FMN reductase [NAD(P)H]
MTSPTSPVRLQEALRHRFGETLAVDPEWAGLDELARLAARGTQRRYQPRAVSPALLRLLCACALSAPTKSDLQQGELLVVEDPHKRRVLSELMPDQAWLREAPAFVVVLANGRRLPQLCELRGKPFVNDHLDAFFNASVDAGIVLSTLVRAAEAVGLGCCPVSVIREHGERVSELLELPTRVLPLAGLCLGWPVQAARISVRLPLQMTLHQDRYDEGDVAQRLQSYDERRAALEGVAAQRDVARWGQAAFHGWSEDKARQFAVPHCAGFGSFVRGQGFRFD